MIVDRSRVVATLWHLLASVFIATMAAALVFAVWYPGPLRDIAGGRELFFLVVSVDVILGPLLTLAVFNIAKSRKELLIDISIVVALQLGALIYGLWTVYVAHPVYLVHEVDRFQVIAPIDIDKNDLKAALPIYQKIPLWGVKVIGVRGPKTDEERLKSLDLALAGKDVSKRPGWWQPLGESHRKIMEKRGRPFDHLKGRVGFVEADALEMLDNAKLQPADVWVFPVVGHNTYWSVLINKHTMGVVGYLPVDSF